jgi:DNA polymerase-3 subunit delta'
VPLVPLVGHEATQARLAALADQGALPASILLQGPPGIGKQRLALWLGQRLLCEAPNGPCGTCAQCRLTTELQHPDLRWFFPRERITGDPDSDEVDEAYRSEIQDRVAAHGLYARPEGSTGIYKYVATLITRLAALSPSLARRKVFVFGDAERMVPQEANPETANAILKLLEEPPADTTFILTSSEPGTLLPTIRSRVVAFRVPTLPEAAVRRFLDDPHVKGVLPSGSTADLIRLAGGAPGALIGAVDRSVAIDRARQLLTAAESGREAMLRAALSSSSSKARGSFSDVLDALTVLLHERTREASQRGDERTARRAARAIPEVEAAKRLAEGNVNPQLITTQVVRALAGGSP